jgi:hypothetical protein
VSNAAETNQAKAVSPSIDGKTQIPHELTRQPIQSWDYAPAFIVPPGADLEASVPPEAVLENPKHWELEGEANDIVSVPPGAVLEDMRPRTLRPVTTSVPNHFQ